VCMWVCVCVHDYLHLVCLAQLQVRCVFVKRELAVCVCVSVCVSVCVCVCMCVCVYV